MKIKAFLFDLDGVLADTSRYHFNAWKLSAKKYGINIPDYFEPKLRGISRMKSAELILNASPVKLNSSEINNFIEEKNKYYISAVQNLSVKDRLPGVDEIFEFARQKSLKTALVSASMNAEYIIDSLEMIEWFDYVVNPRYIKSKPSPDLFLTAARTLKVDPYECIGFEDASAGIAGIKAANMLAIGIGENLGADYHVSSLNEAMKILKNNFEGVFN